MYDQSTILLDQRRRWWSGIESALGQRNVLCLRANRYTHHLILVNFRPILLIIYVKLVRSCVLSLPVNHINLIFIVLKFFYCFEVDPSFATLVLYFSNGRGISAYYYYHFHLYNQLTVAEHLFINNGFPRVYTRLKLVRCWFEIGPPLFTLDQQRTNYVRLLAVDILTI